MTERPSDDQLKQWLYDAEFDHGAVGEGHDFAAHPLPGDTFPHYYADDYKATLVLLFRELLDLRSEVRSWRECDGK